MAYLSESEDIMLLEALRMGSRRAFSLLFDKYYVDITMYAGTFLPEREACEDLVQNVFLKLWNIRGTLRIETSLKRYLMASTRNSCLNEIAHRKIVSEHVRYALADKSQSDDYADGYCLYTELQSIIGETLGKCAAREREAFELSRLGGLTYKKIAELQHCSVRTVEVRIAKVLKLLKDTIDKNSK